MMLVIYIHPDTHVEWVRFELTMAFLGYPDSDFHGQSTALRRSTSTSFVTTQCCGYFPRLSTIAVDFLLLYEINCIYPLVIMFLLVLGVSFFHPHAAVRNHSYNQKLTVGFLVIEVGFAPTLRMLELTGLSLLAYSIYTPQSTSTCLLVMWLTFRGQLLNQRNQDRT